MMKRKFEALHNKNDKIFQTTLHGKLESCFFTYCVKVSINLERCTFAFFQDFTMIHAWSSIRFSFFLLHILVQWHSVLYISIKLYSQQKFSASNFENCHSHQRQQKASLHHHIISSHQKFTAPSKMGSEKIIKTHAAWCASNFEAFRYEKVFKKALEKSL